MKRTMLFLMLLAVIGTSATAATVAYWRFEEGPAGSVVPKTVGGYTYEESVPDSSGNGYELSVWDTTGAGQVYRTQVATPVVTGLGLANNFSSKNNGGGPCMWTNPADPISTMTPAQWTVEATFKLENSGGNKTVVGRDARNITTDGSSSDLAAMYFQTMSNNRLAIKFVDVAGHFHEAISPNNAYIGYDFGTDPDGNNAEWYSMAATSDGLMLSLYLLHHGVDTAYQLIAQTDMTTSGSTNTALSNGAGGVAGTGDWTAGIFSVARGLWAGGHADRGYGYIDEVRISDTALNPDEFLMHHPVQPSYPVQDEYLILQDPITYTWTSAIPAVLFDHYDIYIADNAGDLAPQAPSTFIHAAELPNEATTSYAGYTGAYDYGEDYYWRIDMTALDPNYAVADPNFPEYNIPVLYQGAPVRFYGPRACAALTMSDDVAIVPDMTTHIYAPQSAVFTSDIQRGTVDVAAIRWYKVVGTQDDLENPDPNDTADIEITTGITNDPDLATATSTTLTIAAAAPADNGDYYAHVRLVDPIGGGNGCETNSPTANLFVRDDTASGTDYLVHRYGFAGDATDSIGGADGVVADLGDSNHDFVNDQIVLSNGTLNSRPLQAVQVPNPIPGEPNLVMQQLLDQPGAYVDLPNGTISALGKTATFMAWFTYNAADTGNWPRLFDFGTSTAGEGFSTGGDGVQYLDGDPTPYLDTTSADAQEYIMMSPKRDAGPGWRYESVSRPAPAGAAVGYAIDPAGTGASQVATAPNEVCVACVFDGVNGVMTVYVNGVQVGQNTNLQHDLADLNDVNNWLGRSAWQDAMFSGSINEFRIYNIALTEPWVEAYYKQGADDYTTTPDPCLAEYNGMDFDENCIVDIDDFVIFADEWLKCGKLSCN